MAERTGVGCVRQPPDHTREQRRAEAGQRVGTPLVGPAKGDL